MATKKKGLARYKAKKAAAKKNPPLVKDLGQELAPAFGAYVATRLLSRIIYTFVQKKWPKAGKHAAAGSALASFGIAYMVAPRWEKTQDYATPIMVGSGIAAGQAIVRTYLPKYGWIVADTKPEDLAPTETEPAAEVLEAFGADSLDGGGDDGDGLGDDDLADLEAELGGLGSLGSSNLH